MFTEKNYFSVSQWDSGNRRLPVQTCSHVTQRHISVSKQAKGIRICQHAVILHWLHHQRLQMAHWVRANYVISFIAEVNKGQLA